MGARTYIPQLGRFLQPDPQPAGSANAYAYTFGDPVNTFDPGGESTVIELIEKHASEVAAAETAKEDEEIRARRAFEEALARTQAEEAARQASWDAALAGPQYTGAIATAVVAGVTALATTGCAASAALTADPFEAFDCYKIGVFGATLTFAIAASTFQAWNDTRN